MTNAKNQNTKLQMTKYKKHNNKKQITFYKLQKTHVLNSYY